MWVHIALNRRTRIVAHARAEACILFAVTTVVAAGIDMINPIRWPTSCLALLMAMAYRVTIRIPTGTMLIEIRTMNYTPEGESRMYGWKPGNAEGVEG